MASRETVLSKLGAIYQDPVRVAEAPDLPRRDLIARDDVSSSSAVVFGTLVAIGSQPCCALKDRKQENQSVQASRWEQIKPEMAYSWRV
jgi:hypothetical protein